MTDLDECRAYAAHLLAEHRRLQELVREIQTIFENRDETLGEVKERLVKGFRSLRSELSRHFAEEDEGGCIEEAVSRIPSLSSAATELENQHPLLLDSLDCLIDHVAKAPVGGRAAELEKEFATLAQQLNTHEAAENRVLERGFGVNLDADYAIG